MATPTGIIEKDYIYCEKCHKTMRAIEFYYSNNKEKFPLGKMNICKKCLTMHVDNWKPETYLWILQDVDVPFIQEEWESLLLKYGKDPSKVTGTTIIGRYLAKMKLTQYSDYRWKDNEYLRKIAENRIEVSMKQQGYSASEIAEAVNQALTVEIPEGELAAPPPTVSSGVSAQDTGPAASYFDSELSAEIENEMVSDLTDDDKRYLLMKWGKTYQPQEWIKLEQFYNEMTDSYEVQGAGHEDTLKLVCKTSLKANQLLDIGDVDGAQKMLKMYDGLMKSGKFTAAQNKAEKGEVLDSVSELVTMCEKEGFIPRYYVSAPGDKVDETLMDLKNYTRTLMVEEMNLGNLIENAMRTMSIEENKEEDTDDEEEEILADFKEINGIKDNDYEEYTHFLSDQEEVDNELLRKLEAGEI